MAEPCSTRMWLGSRCAPCLRRDGSGVTCRVSAGPAGGLAEQDGCMMQLRQKATGGFRSADGAADFATVRSVLSTARKQGWNLLQALTADPANLRAALRLA